MKCSSSDPNFNSALMTDRNFTKGESRIQAFVYVVLETRKMSVTFTRTGDARVRKYIYTTR